MTDQTATNSVPAAEAITREQAVAIARRVVAGIEGPERVLEDGRTVEKPYGWVFFYASRKYLESRHPGDLIPGDGPLVVERAGGRTQFLPTSVPPAAAMTEFERRWRERPASAGDTNAPPPGATK